MSCAWCGAPIDEAAQPVHITTGDEHHEFCDWSCASKGASRRADENWREVEVHPFAAGDVTIIELPSS
jgi:hypothetical protein